MKILRKNQNSNIEINNIITIKIKNIDNNDIIENSKKYNL